LDRYVEESHGDDDSIVVPNWTRPNTVDLGCQDGDGVVGGLGGLWRVAVLWALDGPVAHLALDDAGVGA